MSVYAIADLHLSFGTDKPMNVFSGWSNYEERLKKNWESIVNEDDTVIIIGDISWAMNLSETKEDFNFINKLPGKKILLKGNHDYWWSTRKKIEDYLDENQFDSISILYNSCVNIENVSICGTRGWFCDESDDNKKILNREVGRLETSISLAKESGLEPIVCLHYPPVYGSNECEEILEVLLKENIKRCYYGHIHGELAAKSAIIGDYKGIKMQLVSCDFLKFMPILVSK